MNMDLSCRAWKVSPDGNHIFIRCFDGTSPNQFYLTNLRTFFTQAVTGKPVSWSPDSQFAILVQNQDQEKETGTYELILAANGILHSIAETAITVPIWDTTGKYLAFLKDGSTLSVLDVDIWTIHQTSLPHRFISLSWQPQGDDLAALAEDGSLWRLPNLAVDAIEPLTLALPDVRDVHWSPDGEHLAFVSGPDVYVVSIKETGDE
jgi:WD40 repeat protein